jgi:hypothetical protein
MKWVAFLLALPFALLLAPLAMPFAQRPQGGLRYWLSWAYRALVRDTSEL